MNSSARATVLRVSAVVRLMYALHSFRESKRSSRRSKRGGRAATGMGESSHDLVLAGRAWTPPLRRLGPYSSTNGDWSSSDAFPDR